MHIVRCHMQLPFVACKVAHNGGDLSLSRGTATVEGGDAVARGRWADAPSDLSAGYTDTTHRGSYTERYSRFTSVEEMPDRDNKADKYYYVNWFVRD